MNYRGDDPGVPRAGYSPVRRDGLRTAVSERSPLAGGEARRRGDVPIPEAFALVREDWRAASDRGQVSARVLTMDLKALSRLESYLLACDALLVSDVDEELACDWIVAPDDPGIAPAPPSLMTRRALVRAVWRSLRALGLDDRAVGIGIVVPRLGETVVRPFADEHVPLLRHAALSRNHTIRTAITEMALAGVALREMPLVAVHHVYAPQRRLWVPGFPGRTAPRWAVLDEYGADALATQVRWLSRLRRHKDGMPGHTPLVYRVYATKPHPEGKSTNSVDVSLGNVIKAAGLQAQGYRATSFREYVAVRTWRETGRVEAVAATLGVNSLDTASRILRVALGRRWRDEHGVHGPDDLLAARLGDDAARTPDTGPLVRGRGDGLHHDGTPRLDLYRRAQAAAVTDHHLHRALDPQRTQVAPAGDPDGDDVDVRDAP